MKSLVLLLALVLLAACVSAADLDDLTLDFRESILETDTSRSLIPDTIVHTFINMAQDKIVRLGGFLRKTYTFVYHEDSSSFGLPSTFKSIGLNGVMRQSAGIFSQGDWFSIVYNPGFRKDTIVAHYTVGWDTTDTPRLYIKGNIDEDDSIKVFYRARATAMATGAAVCQVPADEHIFIIEEAISLYEKAKRSHQVMQLLQQTTRMDMGIIKQGGQ